jgi:hypothetical protein
MPEAPAVARPPVAAFSPIAINDDDEFDPDNFAKLSVDNAFQEDLEEPSSGSGTALGSV